MPGTGLARNYPRLLQLAWKFVLPVMTLLPGVSTMQNSGKALAGLVTIPSLENTTAKYFDYRDETPSSRDSHDEEKAKDLWEESIKLVKLKSEETILKIES